MKKLLIFVLAAVLMLSLTACGDPAAYELYTKMNEKQKDIKSVEIKTDAAITINVMGQDMEMSMSGIIKQIIRSETDIDMEMIMTTSAMGQEIPATAYFKDGVLYQDTMGQKYKMALDLDAALQLANTAQLEFGEDAIKSSSVTKTGSDSMLSFELEPEFLKETLSTMTDSIANSLGTGADASMTFTQMKYDLLVDKDYMMKSTKMDFTVDMDIMGESATMHYIVTLDVVGYNNISQIDFPSDLDTYPEV